MGHIIFVCLCVRVHVCLCARKWVMYICAFVCLCVRVHVCLCARKWVMYICAFVSLCVRLCSVFLYHVYNVCACVGHRCVLHSCIHAWVYMGIYVHASWSGWGACTYVHMCV